MLQRMCFIITLLVCLAGLKKANAAEVVLEWDPSSSPTVVGYRVYYGTTSGSYPYKIDAGGATTATLTNLAAGATYFFVATAYDGAGNESPFSSEITYVVPEVLRMTAGPAPGSAPALWFPARPGHWYEIQATTDLKNWGTLWRSGLMISNLRMRVTDPDARFYTSRFYRLVEH